MGFGVIKVSGNGVSLIIMDVLKLSSKTNAYERLQVIHSKVCELVKLHSPQALAIEAPFFGKNVQSMLKLGRATGRCYRRCNASWAFLLPNTLHEK